MFRKKVADVFKWVIDQIDPLIGLLLASIFSIAGIFGFTNPTALASATLGTLTLLAITLIRERKGRETLENKINHLVDSIESPPPDLFFKQSTNENPLLKEAESEAWLVQETGSLITEKNQSEVISLLQRGGKVKAVVTAPAEGTARLMAFRNATLAYDTIIARYVQFRGQIVSILDRVEDNAERLEVRFIPYPIGATSVIIDPDHPEKTKRRAIIRYAGFRVPYAEKPDFIVRGDTSPQTFALCFKETKIMFESASKIVLLTGAPRSGKTTIMEGLVECYKSDPNFFYVIVRALTSGTERTGFAALTSAEPTPKRFATRKSDGTYEVDTEVWSSITSQLEGAYRSKKIILLDEIGPLQLQTPKFVSLIDQIVDDPAATMFATVALDNSHFLIKKVKRHYRSTLLELNPNKDGTDISGKLKQELKASLRLVNYIPHVLWEGAKS